MSPKQDHLVKILKRQLVDEVLGPLDPRIHNGLPPELTAAYSVASIAVYLEAAAPVRAFP